MIKSSNHLWRNDITGLRALAVIPVLIYHAFPEILPYGFFGVDIFFVISGYLISGIIFRQLLSSKFSFLLFYEKRIRRIFPNLILCLIFCLGVGWFTLTAEEYSDLAKHVLASSFFIQNFNLLSEVGYFTEEALRKPLLHLWSLAIEEQFYIIFPVVCLLLWKVKCSPKNLGILVFLIFVISLAFCFSISDQSVRFYFPIARFWELGLGIIIAYYETFTAINFRLLPQKLRSFLSILGLFFILFPMVEGGETFQLTHPGFITLFPVLGAGLLLVSWPDALVNQKLLCLKMLTFTGLISYSLYLWHWPLLSFTYIVIPNPSNLCKFIVLVVSFAISSLLYVTFEQPIRRSQFQLWRMGVCSLNSVTLSIICLLSLGIVLSSGVKWRSFNHNFSNLFGSVRSDTADYGWKQFHTINGYSKDLKVYGTGFPSILFVGDSHLYAYQHRIVKLSEQYGVPVAILSYSGCFVPSGYKVGGNKRQKSKCEFISKEFYRLLSDKRIDTLVIGQMWGSYLSNNKSSMISGIKRANEYIKNLSSSYVILDAPWGEGNQFDPLSKINRLNLESSDFSVRYAKKGRWYEGNALAEKTFVSKVRFIRPEKIVCQDFKCDSLKYRDGHHLRNSYLAENANWIDQIFINMRTQNN